MQAAELGGASIWLAEHTEATYVGITLSDVQVDYAQRYIKQRGVGDRVSVRFGNYFDTKFPDAHFDKIFAIESFCHAYPDLTGVYKEMMRILKPGGRLVISDGVYLRKPKDEEEERISKEYCEGFKLAAMITPDEILGYLTAAGFHNLKHFDKTREIGKSIEYIHNRSQMVKPFRFLKYVGLVTQIEVENLLATLNQKKMYQDGFLGEAVFQADKPRLN